MRAAIVNILPVYATVVISFFLSPRPLLMPARIIFRPSLFHSAAVSDCHIQIFSFKCKKYMYTKTFHTLWLHGKLIHVFTAPWMRIASDIFHLCANASIVCQSVCICARVVLILDRRRERIFNFSISLTLSAMHFFRAAKVHKLFAKHPICTIYCFSWFQLISMFMSTCGFFCMTNKKIPVQLI